MGSRVLNSSIPSILTPFDQEFHEIPEEILHWYDRVQPLPISKRAQYSYEGENATSKAIQTLRDSFPTQVFVLDSDEYEYVNSTWTGNLLDIQKAPAAVFRPDTTDKVVQLVKFVQNENIRFSIKCGGHSNAGYCLNLGGVVLDMSAMKNPTISNDGTEMTIPGGCRWKHVYDELKRKKSNKIVVGGLCPSVGVSGYILGGGISPFSRGFGLGIDSVTEMTVVTAAKQVITLNHQDSDKKKRELFWALLGGGGGNFGILVEFKVRLHDLHDPKHPRVACGLLSWELPRQQFDFERMMRVLNETSWPNNLTIDTMWRHRGDQLFGDLTIVFNGTTDECSKVIHPLLAYNHHRCQLKEMLWYDWIYEEDGYDPTALIFHHTASFVFGQGGITPNVTQNITSLMTKTIKLLGDKGKCRLVLIHAGGKTKKPRDDTSFFWREGVYFGSFKVQWTVQDEELRRKIVNSIEDAREVLLPYALDRIAAYVNFIDRTLEEWEYAYYGKNYEKLQRIKLEWDPMNFFDFKQGIKPSLILPKEQTEGEEGGDLSVESEGTIKAAIVT